MLRATLSAAFVLALAAPAQAQGVSWATDWDEALEEAKARNVPILWSKHADR